MNTKVYSGIIFVFFFSIFINPAAAVKDLGLPNWQGEVEGEEMFKKLAELPDIMSTHEIKLKFPGKAKKLQKDTKISSDSDGTIAHLPPQLKGRDFIYAEKPGFSVEVKKPGYIAALTIENSNANEKLARMNFKRVNLRAFPLAKGRKQNYICLQKKIEKTGRLDIPEGTLIIFGIADSGGIPYSEMKSLEPKVYLPDGREFKTWEIPFEFSKTYYVDQKKENASDENPGTEQKPFKTISKAAQVLKPGEKVIVKEGIYRETVKPARGGTNRDNIISYEAAPGENVTITGAEPLNVLWTKSTEDPTLFPFAGSWNHPWDEPRTVHHNMKNLWMCKIPDESVKGYNPFAEVNLPQWMLQHLAVIGRRGKDLLEQNSVYFNYRGMLFQDNRRLSQYTMWEDFKRKGQPGSFWVAMDGRTLHVRPFDDTDPAKSDWQITTRKHLFCPDKYNLGYIRVKGFTFEKAANPFPIPQYGAVSTNAGHHWIIEENIIRKINSIGLELGKRAWEWNTPDLMGHHIVRKNHITGCGICGITGIGGDGFTTLIENNLIEKNAYFEVCEFMETGGIKTHFNRNSLVKGNIIRDTYDGSALWLDFGNINCRVTQNVIADSNSIWGALFFEASLYHNMIDNNFVWGNNKHGIYQHTCQKLIIANNFTAKNENYGLVLGLGTRNVYGRVSTGGNHKVYNNIIWGNKKTVMNPPKAPDSSINNNITENIEAQFDPDTLELTWKYNGDYEKSTPVPFVDFDFFSQPKQDCNPPGPFSTIPERNETLKLIPPGMESFFE